MERNAAAVPAKKAYWSNYAHDHESSDESESIVPGVKRVGNRRPNKMQGRKTKEIKAKIPIRQPVVEELCPTVQETSQSCDDSSSVVSQKDRKQSKQVSLKDLSEVDKKRIANLVKELARMGEEREKAVGQLHTERQQFEKQVVQLVEQQEKILNEREDIQSRLFQCQDLLTKYQDKIMEKQDGTTECSLSQRSLSHGTLCDSDETFRFSDISELTNIHSVTPRELNKEVSIQLPKPSAPQQPMPENPFRLSNSSNNETFQSKSEKSKLVYLENKAFKKVNSKIETTKRTTGNSKRSTSNSQIALSNSKTAIGNSEIDSGNSKITAGNSKMSYSKKNDKISKNSKKKPKWISPIKDPWVENGRCGNHSKLEKIFIHPVDYREINLVQDKTTVSLLEKISWLDPKRDEINRGKVGKKDKIATQGTKAVDRRTPSALKRRENRSRSHSPDDVYPSPRSSGDENYHKTHRNITESMNSGYPLRPFTSKIDKEIALQRSFNEREGLSTILSERLEQNTGEKRIEYMDKVPVMKVFREPIMSSTQKSSELNPYASSSQESNYEALVPDSSPRSSQVSDLEYKPPSVKDKENCKAKVGFKDKLLEVDYDNAKLHSPNLGSSSGVFGDKSFMKYYKKLSQTDRKRELLRQRESLLDEQRRLKDILRIQEKQLNNKQEQLHRQQTLQQERLAYFEKNGQFPLGRLELDTEDENHSCRRLLVEKSKKFDDFVKPEIQFSSPRTLPTKPGSTEQRYSDIGDDGSLFGGEVKRLNFDRHADEINEDDIEEEAAAIVNESPRAAPARTTTGTSPIHRSQLLQMSAHSIATSPIRMDQSSRSVHTPTRQIDAATSVSHVNISPRSQKSTESVEDLILGRQGNLPLQSNRGRSSQSPVANGSHTPGDKTLSVMEIVNSMDQSPSWTGSHAQNQFGTPPLRVTKAPAEHNEEEEESQLLEDVFFLRG